MKALRKCSGAQLVPHNRAAGRAVPVQKLVTPFYRVYLMASPSIRVTPSGKKPLDQLT